MNNWVRYFKTRQSESEYFWNFLTCLSVPEFDVPVVATAEELCARVVEGYVPHGLFVTAVGPHTAPVVVHLPDLHKEKVDKCQALCNQYVSQLYIEVETMQKLLSFSIKVSVGETILIPGRLKLWKPNKPWKFLCWNLTETLSSLKFLHNFQTVSAALKPDISEGSLIHSIIIQEIKVYHINKSLALLQTICE